MPTPAEIRARLENLQAYEKANNAERVVTGGRYVQDVSQLLAENDRLSADVEGWVCIAAENAKDAAKRLEQAEAIVKAAQAWKAAKQAIPVCIGYEGQCDGDLGEAHVQACPCYGGALSAALRVARTTETALLASLETPGAGTGDAKVR